MYIPVFINIYVTICVYMKLNVSPYWCLKLESIFTKDLFFTFYLSETIYSNSENSGSQLPLSI